MNGINLRYLRWEFKDGCSKRMCTGFVHLFGPKIQGFFKDFPGPYFEILRTFI